eukprot:2724131-Prymnesium_polylepis.1
MTANGRGIITLTHTCTHAGQWLHARDTATRQGITGRLSEAGPKMNSTHAAGHSASIVSIGAPPVCKLEWWQGTTGTDDSDAWSTSTRQFFDLK